MSVIRRELSNYRPACPTHSRQRRVLSTRTAGVLPAITSVGKSKAILSASGDILKILSGGEIPLSYDINLPISLTSTYPVKVGSYDIASLVLAANLKAAQKFKFVPTEIDATLTPNFDLFQAQTHKLGDLFSFSVPTSWSGPVELDASYSLVGRAGKRYGRRRQCDTHVFRAWNYT